MAGLSTSAARKLNIDIIKIHFTLSVSGGVLASWLVRLSSDRAVRVRALAEHIMLYSVAGHLTLIVPLSTKVNKWVPATLMLRINLRYAGIPNGGGGGGGGKNTPTRLMLKKPEISSGLMGQLVRMQTLPTFHSIFNPSTGYSLRVTHETTGNDKLSC